MMKASTLKRGDVIQNKHSKHRLQFMERTPKHGQQKPIIYCEVLEGDVTGELLAITGSGINNYIVIQKDNLELADRQQQNVIQKYKQMSLPEDEPQNVIQKKRGQRGKGKKIAKVAVTVRLEAELIKMIKQFGYSQTDFITEAVKDLLNRKTEKRGGLKRNTK